jgi:ABC transport system ATP-binding/permease protein
MILVDLERVSTARPGRPLFSDLSLTLATGDRLGVVGQNGVGKSTLLRVLTGQDEPESGTVRRGRGVRVAWLDQRPELGHGAVRDVVGQGLDPAASGGPDRWEAEAVADRIGLGGLLDADVSTLSGGQAKRVALARALVEPSDLLVLDEPTNHLDIDGIDWLEERLHDLRGGLVIVTHDRHLLDRVTTRILELDRGRGYLHDGGYASYLEARATREAQADAAESTRQNLARKELAWLQRGAPARTRKPKARIEAATAVVEGRREAAARVGIPDLHLGTPRLGDKVIELHDVGFGFEPDQPPLFEGVELNLDNRERLGVVGANGLGKSTLLDLMAGRRRPTTGRVEVGPTVELGYYDQLGATLDPAQRVRDAVTGGARVPDWRDTALLEQFWFSTDTQFAPIGLLSGGERRRLQLLLTLSARPNVLLLDEPTNDLDVDTLRVLEEFLDEWPGALVVVSHDRAFLERTVADVVVLDGTGSVGRRRGGYAAWEAERRARRGQPGSAAAAAGRGGSGGSAAPSKAGGATSPSGAPTGPTGPGSPHVASRSASTVRQLVRQVEKDLARLERRRARLTEQVEAARADHQELARLGAELAEVADQIAELEHRWLELSTEAETAPR